MRDDRELLRCYFEQGSNEAFAELVQRYLDLVYSAAFRKLNGDAHKAKDVSQAVFIKLATHRPSLPQDQTLAGWLYTTTHNTASKAIRTEVRRRRREQEAQTMHEITADHGIPTDWHQVRPLLDDAMLELPVRDRDAILLRFFERRPFAEIGPKLGLTENAARMRVERALDKLHGLLATRGVRSSGAAFGALLATEAVVAAPAGLASGITNAAISAVASSSLTTFTVLTTMTTAKLTALVSIVGLSLAANVLLVAKLNEQDLPYFPGFANAGAASATVLKTPAGIPSAHAGAAGRAADGTLAAAPGSQGTRTTFDLLASKDLNVFAANLRAAGFSSPAIRGAVNRLQRETEEAHRVDVLNSVPLPPFWKTTENAGPTGDQIAEFLRMRAERAATFTQMFPEENEMYLMGLRRRFGSLPDDKLAKIDQIGRDYEQMAQLISAQGLMPWDREKLALLEKESQADIRALLTPQELEDFNLRTSPTAQNLRQLAGFNITEREFRDLYRLRSAYDEKFSSALNAATTPDQLQARTEALQGLNAQIRGTLGEDRYADYVRAADPGLQQTYSLVRQLNLPVASAAATYQIQQEIQQRAGQIRSAPGQTAEQRAEQLRQLAQEATQRLTPLLTASGVEAYKQRSGLLRSLEQAPSSFSPVRPAN